MQQQNEGYEPILTAQSYRIMPNKAYFIAGIICWTVLILAVSAAEYSDQASSIIFPMTESQQHTEQHLHNILMLGTIFWGIGLILLYLGHMHFHRQQDKREAIAYELQSFADTLAEVSDIVSTYAQNDILRNNSVDRGTTKQQNYAEEEHPNAVARVLAAEDQGSDLLLTKEAVAAAQNKKMILLNINKVIRTCLCTVAPDYESIAEIATNLCPELPPVYAMASDMNQIFYNILSNGLQAIHKKYQQHPEEKKGMLLISSRLFGEHIQIQFDDDGIGIPEGIREMLFEPFSDGQVKGLAIVHQLITDKYKGSISFNSDEGEGTIVSLLLPTIQI